MGCKATPGVHVWKGWANWPILFWAATSSGWLRCGWCSGRHVLARCRWFVPLRWVSWGYSFCSARAAALPWQCFSRYFPCRSGAGASAGASLGRGAPPSACLRSFVFDHAHNLFTHVAIELGLPGLLLWAATWIAVLREAWKVRETLYAKGIIGIWLFSTLAMQFDAASLNGTPRAEWFISWLPIGLASVLVWARVNPDACDKISRSS